MDNENQRKAPPSFIYVVWQAIREISTNDSAELPKIARELCRLHRVNEKNAASLLNNMVKDGFLNVIKPTRASKPPIYMIPDFELLEQRFSEQKPAHDYYCYECHMPGDKLTKCIECFRVYHKFCVKESLDQPLFSLNEPIPDYIQTAFQQVYEYPYLSSMQSNDSNKSKFVNESSSNTQSIENGKTTEMPPTTKTSEKELMRGDAQNVNLNLQRNSYDLITGDDDCSSEMSNNNLASLIRDQTVQENNEELFTLCFKCRLVKHQFYDISSNFNTDEINQLLALAFKRVQSWINVDTFSRQENSSVDIPDSDLDYLKKLLFYETVTTELITNKLKNKEYKSLTQLVTDVLDVNHCIGVLRGTDSSEFEASKYLVLDILREVLEIRLCPDCYRYSNMKKKDDSWFTMPCKTYHKLVFAKQIGFSYWPAKILRIMDNNKYDVRFFGGKHQRAIIDDRNIKPIETHLKSLKIKQTASFKNAMKEVKAYRDALEENTIDNSHEMKATSSKDVDLEATLEFPLNPEAELGVGDILNLTTSSDSVEIISNILSDSELNSSKSENDLQIVRKRSLHSIQDNENELVYDSINTKRPRMDNEMRIVDQNSSVETIEIPASNSLIESEPELMEDDSKVSSSTPIKNRPTCKDDFERCKAVENLRFKLSGFKTIKSIREIAIETLDIELAKCYKQIQEMKEQHKNEINALKNILKK